MATLPCGVDCSTINAGKCKEATCDLVTKTCTVGSLDDGSTCDDDTFCTIDDSCLAGECIGGPSNTCGMTPAACQAIICNESTQNCSAAPGQDGTPCQSGNLCLINATCQGGLCAEGQLKDCFFAPKPDACHVSECDPMSGLCAPVPGNDGDPCEDLNDLCVVGKTCGGGTCIGGSPKDCTALSVGCNVGTCDVQTSNCVAVPAGEGNPCDDLDGCTTGEACQSGQCAGGTITTSCANNDGCCPMGCDENNDDDCNQHATCLDLVTTMNMWGKAAKGVDLRAWTGSTLHYIGCNGDGCSPASFSCTFNANAKTLEFGSTGTVRSMIDPGNQNGDAMATSYSSCCSANQQLGLCNAPDGNNNGVSVNNAQALCKALGYNSGQLVASSASNSCPEAHALDTSGKSWSTDFVNSQGYGRQWKCSGF